MIVWFEGLSPLAAGVLVVGGFIAFCMCLGVAIRRVAPRETRRQHNDLAGFILAVVGVIYAVLLAFVAVGVWERFDHAEVIAAQEASSLEIVYRDAGDFAQGHRLRGELTRYARIVVEREWPAMVHGEESPEAAREIGVIDNTLRALTVATPSESNVQARMLLAFDDALADRDARLSTGATGINPLMWLVLVLGAVVTVGFTFLFGFEELKLELAMTGALAFLIGLVLYLALALDFPFRGSISVQPDALLRTLEAFRAIGP